MNTDSLKGSQGAKVSTTINPGDNEIAVFMRYFVVNILPYMVVFGSIMLKVPQIATIVRYHSAAGVSLVAVMLDLSSYVISTSWGIAQALDFKDYGENLFVTVEVAVLLILVGHFQKCTITALASLIAQMMALVIMSSGTIPRDVHKWLLGAQIIIGLSSRVPQIILNFKNQSTGQLSFATFYLAFVGGTSRFLTTFHNVPLEKGRNMLLSQFGVSIALNALILTQILAYRSNTNAKLLQEQREREKTKGSAEVKETKKDQ